MNRTDHRDTPAPDVTPEFGDFADDLGPLWRDETSTQTGVRSPAEDRFADDLR